MKTFFVPSTRKVVLDENLLSKISKKIPKNIGLVYSIQFKDVASKIKTILEKDHKITVFSQVLGCTFPKISKGTEAILLVGSGKFHAVSLAYETKTRVFIFEPNYLEEISEFDIWDFEKRKKGAYAKFLVSNKIGIIISNKPGQERFEHAVKSKKSFKGKKSYLFIANEVNTADLENFPDIGSWVNTSCPRLDMADSRIINYKEIKA